MGIKKMVFFFLELLSRAECDERDRGAEGGYGN